MANAIGSAISKVSGTCEKLVDYNELPREQALEQLKAEAVELAVQAGAVRETVEIIDVEDVTPAVLPRQYLPGEDQGRRGSGVRPWSPAGLREHSFQAIPPRLN